MRDQARIAQRVEQWLLRDLKQTADELLDCTAAAAQRLGQKQGSLKSNQKELLESSFDGLIQQVVKLRCSQRRQLNGHLPPFDQSQPGLGPAYTSILASTDEWHARGGQLEQDQELQSVQVDSLAVDSSTGHGLLETRPKQAITSNLLTPAQSSELLPTQQPNSLEISGEQQPLPPASQHVLQCFDHLDSQPISQSVHILPHAPGHAMLLPPHPFHLSAEHGTQQNDILCQMPDIMRPDREPRDYADQEHMYFTSQMLAQSGMNSSMMIDIPHPAFNMGPAQIPMMLPVNNNGMHFDMNPGLVHTGMPHLEMMPMIMQQNPAPAPLMDAVSGFQHYDLPHLPMGSHWHSHMP